MAAIVGGRHNDRMDTLQATLSQLWIYPIKSCAGLSLSQATLTPTGLAWDRAFMVVDAEGEMLTQRELPRMALIQPVMNADAPNEEGRNTVNHGFSNPVSAVVGDVMQVRAVGMPDLTVPLTLPPAQARTQVRVWDDTVWAYDMGDAVAAWFNTFLRDDQHPEWGELRLVRFDPAHARPASRTWTKEYTALNQFSDGFPLLVTSTASLDELNQRLNAQAKPAVDVRRFRPNVVLSGVAAHDEDRVAQLRVRSDMPRTPAAGGPVDAAPTEVVLQLVKPCPRCPMPNIDPDTAMPGTAVMDALQAYRQDARINGAITFGMNAFALHGVGQVLRVGQSVAGDWVFD